jgi:hypothetical protein
MPIETTDARCVRALKRAVGRVRDSGAPLRRAASARSAREWSRRVTLTKKIEEKI